MVSLKVPWYSDLINCSVCEDHVCVFHVFLSGKVYDRNKQWVIMEPYEGKGQVEIKELDGNSSIIFPELKL